MILVLAFSCVKENFYDKSEGGRILELQISGQSEANGIFDEVDSIEIQVAHGIDLSTVE